MSSGVAWIAPTRARVGDPQQDLLLLRGEALDRVDEIRHQIRAALILVHDLGPARLDLLVGGLQGVIPTTRQKQHRTSQRHRSIDPTHVSLRSMREW